MPLSDDTRDIARLRFAAQGIKPATGALIDAADIVQRLGAVQAQDYLQSLWALGVRIPHGRSDAVVEVIGTGRIVRTWGLRGTLHWLPAEDVEWIRALVSPRILPRIGPKAWERHGLDPVAVDRAADVLDQELRDGHPIARAALSAALTDAGLANDRQQHYIVYSYLSVTGLLVHGPRLDDRETFALSSAWLPPQRTLSHEESLGELAARYFTSHGPATLSDLANWSGLTKRDARIGLEQAAGRLASGSWGGEEHWLGPDAAEARGVVLVPAFDETVIGYADRSPSFRRYGVTPISSSNGIFYALVIEDGQVAGTWRHLRRKTGVEVQVRAQAGLDPSELEHAAERFASFHGLALTLRSDSL